MVEAVIGFVAGTVMGAGVMVWHSKGIEKAVAKLRGEKDSEIKRLRESNAQLRADRNVIEQTRDCADAYRRGRQDGRADPMTRAERFAKTFEGRKVEFIGGGQKSA